MRLVEAAALGCRCCGDERLLTADPPWAAVLNGLELPSPAVPRRFDVSTFRRFGVSSRPSVFQSFVALGTLRVIR